MLTTIEGIYKDGKIELLETPVDIGESRVLVTFVDAAVNGDKGPAKTGQRLRYGMFKGDRDTTEEDFKIAEFHGDPDDGLDWP